MKKFIILLAVVMMSVLPVAAHEGRGFKHMKGNSGPIIKSKPCGGSLTQLWYIDVDQDGVADYCNVVFFNHEKIHVKRIEAADGGCFCPEIVRDSP